LQNLQQCVNAVTCCPCIVPGAQLRKKSATLTRAAARYLPAARGGTEHPHHSRLQHADRASGGAVLIPPEVRQRAAARVTILDAVVRPFDPADKWFD